MTSHHDSSIAPLARMGLSSAIAHNADDTPRIARVFTAHRDRFAAVGLHGDINLYLPGKLQFAEASLTVGDWCLMGTSFEDESGKRAAIVEGVLPRATTIERMIGGRRQLIAANVDVAFIVTSANHDLNFNRLQRYILLARNSGVTPVIVLSKIDLCPDAAVVAAGIATRLDGIEVIPTTTADPATLAPLRERLASGHATGIFLGSSGVGKSTLVNHLLGEQVQDTGGIREDDSRGRHTTSHRQLFMLDSGGLIIDSPGLRELSVAAGDEDLDEVFSKIMALAEHCQYRNCRHEGEPGCAVQAAIEAGELPQKELDNYRKLEREAAYHEQRTNKEAMSNAKKRWKKVHIAMRQRKKLGL